MSRGGSATKFGFFALLVLAVLAGVIATDPPRENTTRGPRTDNGPVIETVDPVCTTCDSVGTKDDSPQDQSNASYVGNTRSHKFHRLTCRYAGCPNCTATFSTREAAIAAGYRPGGCCDP
jgi:hypothetical protein